jgi:hypothetical protein
LLLITGLLSLSFFLFFYLLGLLFGSLLLNSLIPIFFLFLFLVGVGVVLLLLLFILFVFFLAFGLLLLFEVFLLFGFCFSSAIVLVLSAEFGLLDSQVVLLLDFFVNSLHFISSFVVH